MRTGAIIAATLSAGVFVSVVQYKHHKEFPLTTPRMEMNIRQAEREPLGIIWIFGHAYSSEQVRSWFEMIEGRYCTYGDRIYTAGNVPGQSISYPQFVLALQQGFYFHELAGVGARSDGERRILAQTHASQIRKDRTDSRIRRIRN